MKGSFYLRVRHVLGALDVGVAQNVMFSAGPSSWGMLLHAHGVVRLLVDAAFPVSISRRRPSLH